MVKFIILTLTGLVLSDSQYQEQKPSRQSKEKLKQISEDEVLHLNRLYDCPDPLKPRNYFPLGCHKKHDEHFGDAEQYPSIMGHHWNEPEDYICKFHKTCMHYCRSWKSPVNQCIHPNNSNLMLKGIKCNCMCASSCTDILNDAIESFGFRPGKGFLAPEDDEDDHPVKTDTNVEDQIASRQKYKNRQIYKNQLKMIEFIEFRLDRIENVFEITETDDGLDENGARAVNVPVDDQDVYLENDENDGGYVDGHGYIEAEGEDDHEKPFDFDLLGGKSFFEAEDPDDPYMEDFFHGEPLFRPSYIEDRQEQERKLHAKFFPDKSSHDLEIDIHDLPFRQGECEPSNDALQRQKCLEWNFCHPKLYPCKWPKSKLCKHCMKGNSQLPKKFPRCEPCRCKKTVENYASHKNYLNTYLTKIILTTDFKIGTAYCAGEDNATTPDDSFVALVQRTHDAYLDTWDED